MNDIIKRFTLFLLTITIQISPLFSHADKKQSPVKRPVLYCCRTLKVKEALILLSHYKKNIGRTHFRSENSSKPNCLEINQDSLKHERYLTIANSIVRRALSDTIGYHLLRELCAIGPRFVGSENSRKAIKWAKKTMENRGFDRVWLQPVTVPRWARGDKEEAIIIQSKTHKGKELHVASLGGSIGTVSSGIEAEVLEVQNFKELQERKEEAAGKIIFFNRPMDPGIIETFSAYGAAVNQRTSGAIEAAKAGGIGAIVRSVTTHYDNVSHVGTMNYRDGLKKIPAVAIGLIDADFLSSELKKDPHLRIQLSLSCKTLPDTLSYNVIGDLYGWEKPDEVIVIGGHFDSWDKGHGAHDDGAGCIQSMEVLDLFKRLDIRPRRTIRTVFFLNEEFGLNGAYVYGAYTDTCKEKHISGIESDRGALTPLGFYVTSDTTILLKIQSWLPYLNRARIQWIKRGGSGGDVAQIKNPDALIGFVPDVQRYFDFHHSDNDVFEAIHPREMELGSAAMAILVYLISEDGL